MTLDLKLRYSIKLAELICDKLEIDYTDIKESIRERIKVQEKENEERHKESMDQLAELKERYKKPEPLSEAARATAELSFLNWQKIEKERFEAFYLSETQGDNPLATEKLKREHWQAMRKVRELSRRLDDNV